MDENLDDFESQPVESIGGNNNPGNIKDSKTGQFKTFESPYKGLEALHEDLNAKITGNSPHMTATYGKGYVPTLRKVLHVYAPASDDNDPDSYANTVAHHTGIDPDAPLTPEHIDQIMPMMVNVEKGNKVGSQFAKLMPSGNHADTDDFDSLPASTTTDNKDDFANNTSTVASPNQSAEVLPDPGAGLAGSYGAAQGASMGIANWVGPTLGLAGQGIIKGINAGLNLTGHNPLPDNVNKAIQDSSYQENFEKNLHDMQSFDTNAHALHPTAYTTGEVSGAVAPLLVNPISGALTKSAANKVGADTAKATLHAAGWDIKALEKTTQAAQSKLASLEAKAAGGAENLGWQEAKDLPAQIEAAKAEAVAARSAEGKAKTDAMINAINKADVAKATKLSKPVNSTSKAVDALSTSVGLMTNGVTGAVGGHLLAPVVQMVANPIKSLAKFGVGAAYGTHVGNEILDTPKNLSAPSTLHTDDIDKYQSDLGEYYQPLKDAATNGGNSLAVRQFVMSQKDPSFNSRIMDIQDKKAKGF